MKGYIRCIWGWLLRVPSQRYHHFLHEHPFRCSFFLVAKMLAHEISTLTTLDVWWLRTSANVLLFDCHVPSVENLQKMRQRSDKSKSMNLEPKWPLILLESGPCFGGLKPKRMSKHSQAQGMINKYYDIWLLKQLQEPKGPCTTVWPTCKNIAK